MAGCAPMEHLRAVVRARLDRPVRRPRHRRQETLLLQGPPVPDDWAAMAADRRVSARGHSLLEKPTISTLNEASMEVVPNIIFDLAGVALIERLAQRQIPVEYVRRHFQVF